MAKDESEVIHDIAAQLLAEMVEAANEKDVCAHCVGKTGKSSNSDNQAESSQ